MPLQTPMRGVAQPQGVKAIVERQQALPTEGAPIDGRPLKPKGPSLGVPGAPSGDRKRKAAMVFALTP